MPRKRSSPVATPAGTTNSSQIPARGDQKSEPGELALRPGGEGTLLPVRVTPRAGRTGVDGIVDGALRVRLTAAPVEGAANAALIEFVAHLLDLPKSAISLTSGATARSKMLLVHGLAPDAVRARLRHAAPASGGGRST